MLLRSFCAFIFIVYGRRWICLIIGYLCVGFRWFLLNCGFMFIVFLFSLCCPLLCSISCRLLLDFGVNFRSIYLFLSSFLEFVFSSIRLLVSGLLSLNLNYFSIARFLAKLPLTMNFSPINLALTVHSSPSTLQFPYDFPQ